jgi:uracil-DNA glycosylase
MTVPKRKAGSSITAFFKPDASKAQKTDSDSGNAVQRAVNNFDKEKWVASLTPEQRELLQLEIDTLDLSWLSVLYPELTKGYFLSLKKFLKTEKDKGKKIFPPEKDIYSWSRLTPLHNVKVVILGQDPYHNYNQAHGLAFSVNPPTPPPPSLRNIYKGIQKDYNDFRVPNSGSLIPWCTQGVLLLNACLTVRAHEANSHSKQGWETFTERVLSAALEYRRTGLCFLAWGTPAAQRVGRINPDKTRHLILRSVHPSPLSANRGFFDCGHFKTANQWLLERYGHEGVINWALDPKNVIEEIRRMKMTKEQKEIERALLEDEEKEEEEERLSQEQSITTTTEETNTMTVVENSNGTTTEISETTTKAKEESSESTDEKPK